MNTGSRGEAPQESGPQQARTVEELIQTATRRLQPDAELQMEVAHELRAHLEDAMAEARGDGASEERAQQSALEQFGDPQELSEKLWQANRRRMRLRAVALWGFRATALPVALLLAVVLNWQAQGFLQYLSMLSESSVLQYFGRLKTVKVPFRSDLSENEKAVLEIMQGPWSRMEEASQLVERFPDNPVFHANRVSQFLTSVRHWKGPLPPESLARGLELMDAGERAEPDNAFYNYMKASLLMRISGASDSRTDSTWQTYSPETPSSKRIAGQLTTVVNPDMFERGLAEYRKGLAKPRYCSYEGEMAALRVALRRTPFHVEEVAQSIAIVAGTGLPDLSLMRDLNWTVLGYANALARAGKRDQAAALLAEATVPATQLGLGSRGLMSLLTARSMRRQSLRLGSALYERMEMVPQAAASRALADSEEAAAARSIYLRNYRSEADMRRYAGLMMGTILPPQPLKDPEALFTSVRNAERLGLERAAMGVMAILLLAVLLWNMTFTGVSMFIHRRDDCGPRMLFMGWRRLCVVVSAATLLPLLAYCLFSRSMIGSAQYGINWAWDRMLLEMGATAALMLGLALILGHAAIRARCREAGVHGPGAGIQPWRVATIALLAAAWGLLTVAFLGARPTPGEIWRESLRAISFTIPFAVTIGLLLLRRATPELRSHQATTRRSMTPVWVGCLVLVGIVALGPLRSAERRQTESMHRSVMSLWSDEVSSTAASGYQSYLAGLPDKGMQ